MENSPATSNERDTTGDFMRPAPLPLEPNQTPAERDYAKRVGRKWAVRRRHAAARMYQMFALAGRGELKNRMTMNMVGRWIVEESSAQEPSLTERSRRRAMLMQRWKGFVRSAFDVRRQSRRGKR